MGLIKVKSLDELAAGFRIELKKISRDALNNLAGFIKAEVVEDYSKRVQVGYYPLRDPQTKQEMDSMPPKEIARFVTKTITAEKAVVYIRPGTPADRSGRMQELYGGRPWQKIRVNMQNLDYVNRALSATGMKGLKAKPRI